MGPGGDGHPQAEIVKKKKKNNWWRFRNRGRKAVAREAKDRARGQGQGLVGSDPEDAYVDEKMKRKRNKDAPIHRPGFGEKTKKQVATEVDDAVIAQSLGNLSLNDGEGLSFRDLGLSEEVLIGIQKYGSLERPAFIQRKAIPICIKGRDAIIQAQSGMGKTAALVISVLQRLDRNNPNCQSLIIVPTRELAKQMKDVVNKISKPLTKRARVTCTVCIGGTRKERFEIRCQIVIGTLGRVTSLILKGYLQLQDLKVFALDEADRILDQTCYSRCTFVRDLRMIVQRLPFETQVILMSATMPSSALKTAWCFVRNPVLLLTKNYQLTLDGIHQFHIEVDSYTEKFAVLKDLWTTIEKSRGIIFCKSRREATTVATYLNDMEPVPPFGIQRTGEKEQGERSETMQCFREGKEGFKIIVASDLLGRGIDVQDVNLVINFDLPEYLPNPEANMKAQYIHRIGRAGRYGRKGVAISIVHLPKDKPAFDEIETFFETQIPPLPNFTELANLLKATIPTA